MSLNTEELLRRLDEQHRAYLETFRLVHEALLHGAGNGPTSPGLSAPSPVLRRRRRSTIDADRSDNSPVIRPVVRVTTSLSTNTGETDVSDGDDELYVQDLLPKYQFVYEDLKDHLKKYRFNKEGLKLLETIIDEGGRLLNPELFPKFLEEGSSHNSHYSIFDVGTDGAPLSRHKYVSQGSTIDFAIWQAIQDLNVNANSSRPSVGRITIIREPNPIIMGALHLTMNPHIDMDEVFMHLVSSDGSGAYIVNRAFSDDERHQRSFIFTFDYYTIIGEECNPMSWQLSDKTPPKQGKEHIPISRCSSVVALSLSGPCIKKVKNHQRRAKTQEGSIYDPWAAWHVLNIQCYPDHKHSMDSHEATKNYVNGPEAFMTTILAEFKDAQKRFEEIYAKISKLVTPTAEFMFSRVMRDKLLFEDEEFTYSRRYFWAYQTLGTMNNAIKAIIDSYEHTFTAEFWEGKHKSLWPMIDYSAPRNVFWRKRLHDLKKDFDKEIRGLAKQYEENDDRRKEIRTLRDQLFSGTSVLESRKSVELSAVTILQGHNIKLLTLVSIFFLPLTFVTSVFGMTNMPEEENFKDFGIVMSAVCLPFFILIGSLNTTSGMTFWRDQWHRLLDSFKRKTKDKAPPASEESKQGLKVRERSYSASRAISIRKNQLKGPMSPTRTTSATLENSNRNAVSEPRPVVTKEAMNGDARGRDRKGSIIEDTNPARPETLRPALTWREAMFGRKEKPGFMGHLV